MAISRPPPTQCSPSAAITIFGVCSRRSIVSLACRQNAYLKVGVTDSSIERFARAEELLLASEHNGVNVPVEASPQDRLVDVLHHLEGVAVGRRVRGSAGRRRQQRRSGPSRWACPRRTIADLLEAHCVPCGPTVCQMRPRHGPATDPINASPGGPFGPQARPRSVDAEDPAPERVHDLGPAALEPLEEPKRTI